MTSLNNFLVQHWTHIPPSRAKKTAEYMLFGDGKHLRPQLVYAFGLTCGLTSEDCHPIAAAIEALHTYSLIHDDLPAMDDDDFRRGKPSAHRQFDEASAILAGDLLQSFSFQLISQYPKLVSAFAQGAGAIVTGQSWDIQGDQTLSSIHEAKTGVLFELCCTLPAQLSHHAIAPAKHIGQSIGIWYQMIDDYHDDEPYKPTLSELDQHYQNLLQYATHPALISFIQQLQTHYVTH